MLWQIKLIKGYFFLFKFKIMKKYDLIIKKQGDSKKAKNVKSSAHFVQLSFGYFT